MKYIFLTFISCISFFIFAEPSKPDASKKPLKTTLPDPEANENMQKLFLETLDPTAILKDETPEFVGLKDIKGAPFETMGELYLEKNPKINLSTFIYLDEVNALATVIGGFSGEEMLGPTDRVLVEINDNSLGLGKTYSIFHPRSTFRTSNPWRKWYPYTYSGEATVVAFETKNRAIIQTDGASMASKDDILVPKIDPSRTINPESRIRKPFSNRAKIITLTEDDSKVAGHGDIVFLDKGSDDGLVVNQVLNIYLDPQSRDLKGVNMKSIGTLQIVDISPSYCTAMIIEDSQEVRVGDFAQ